MGITAFRGLMVLAGFLAGVFLLWVAIYTMLHDPDVPERTPIPIEIVRQRMADGLATATAEAARSSDLRRAPYLA